MRLSSLPWLVAGLLLLAMITTAVVRWTGKPQEPSIPSEDQRTAGAEPTPRPTMPSNTPAPVVDQVTVPNLEEVWTRLSGLSTTERAAMLRRLARQLADLPAGEAEDAILDELESGRDAETGLDFVAGEEGLASAPTWRVYLLDQLGLLNPRTAAEYARRAVFPSTKSADEWAISMRNVLQSYPPHAAARGRAEVGQLFSQMTARPEWRAQPSAGMLEAMDFVAHTAEPARHLADLSVWIDEKSEPTANQALQIAVERTVMQRGDEVLPALVSAALAPTGQTGTAVWALAMARADLRRPAQRQAVAAYLLNLAPEAPETTAFFGAFPLRNYSVAPGLTGWPRLPDTQSMRAADEAALDVVTQWGTDPALQAHAESLEGLKEKLRELTGKR